MTNPSPDKIAAQAALAKFLSQKPEPLVSQLDRHDINWEKLKLEDGSYVFQMTWEDLKKFEAKLQSEPTLMEKMAKDMQANGFEQVIAEGF